MALAFGVGTVDTAWSVAAARLPVGSSTRTGEDLPGHRRYRPPTDAPVLDPFRPPPEPWLAGNRGIEYATASGAPMTAIGPGIVTFAGPVGGRLVATVTHPDGLRSSYVQLARLLVGRGQVVRAGEPVGTAAGPVHLGVRRGTTYLDPASLWGEPVLGGRAVLVPLAS